MPGRSIHITGRTVGSLKLDSVDSRVLALGSLICSVVLVFAACGGSGTSEVRSEASCPAATRLVPSNATFVGPDVAFDRYTKHQGDELQSSKAPRRRAIQQARLLPAPRS